MKNEATYSGVVERIGVVQESSGDAGRTCYALLLVGEKVPRILDTAQALMHDEFATVFEIRKQIALTAPGDNIFVRTKGRFVSDYENKTLSARLQ